MQQIHRADPRSALGPHRWWLVTLAIVLTAAVAACGGNDGTGDQSAPTSGADGTSVPSSTASTTLETSTSTSTTAESTTTSTSAPTTASATGVPETATFNVGEKATYDDGSSVQVFAVEQPYVDATSIIGPPAGKEFVSIEVEVCLGSRAETTFGATAWTAYPASGGPLAQRLTTRFPAFLGSGPVSSGSCQRGYVGALADAGIPAAWVVWTQPGWEPVRFQV